MHSLRVGFFLCASALSVGCGVLTDRGLGDGGDDAGWQGTQGDKSGSDAGSTGLASDERAVFARLFGAYCARLVRCGQAFSTECDGYIQYYTHLYTTSAASPAQLSHLSFSPQALFSVQACVAALAADSCADLAPRECLRSYLAHPTGTVPSGGACTLSSDECANPGDSCVGNTCPRHCQGVPTGLEGAPCARDGSCAPGLFCDSVSVCTPLKAGDTPCTAHRECASGSCSTGACLAAAAAGADCSFNPSKPCDTTHYCDATSHCAARKHEGEACAGDECLGAAGCVSGACRPRGGLGASCQTPLDCLDSLQCDAVLRQCQKSTAVDAGQRCTGQAIACNDSACLGATVKADGGVGDLGVCQGPPGCTSHYDCPLGFSCGKAQRCERSVTGSACANSHHCQATDFCASGACEPRASDGATCRVDQPSSCANPTFRCLATPTDPVAKCRAPSALGQPCSSRAGCAGFFVECVHEACIAVGHLGQPCFSGQCVDGACGADGGCVGPLPSGEPCRAFTDCADATCLAGRCAAACQ